jgi:hypothetical protein
MCKHSLRIVGAEEKGCFDASVKPILPCAHVSTQYPNVKNEISQTQMLRVLQAHLQSIKNEGTIMGLGEARGSFLQEPFILRNCTTES